MRNVYVQSGEGNNHHLNNVHTPSPRVVNHKHSHHSFLSPEWKFFFQNTERQKLQKKGSRVMASKTHRKRKKKSSRDLPRKLDFGSTSSAPVEEQSKRVADEVDVSVTEGKEAFENKFAEENEVRSPMVAEDPPEAEEGTEGEIPVPKSRKKGKREARKPEEETKRVAGEFEVSVTESKEAFENRSAEKNKVRSPTVAEDLPEPEEETAGQNVEEIPVPKSRKKGKRKARNLEEEIKRVADQVEVSVTESKEAFENKSVEENQVRSPKVVPEADAETEGQKVEGISVPKPRKKTKRKARNLEQETADLEPHRSSVFPKVAVEEKTEDKNEEEQPDRAAAVAEEEEIPVPKSRKKRKMKAGNLEEETVDLEPENAVENEEPEVALEEKTEDPDAVVEERIFQPADEEKTEDENDQGLSQEEISQPAEHSVERSDSGAHSTSRGTPLKTTEDAADLEEKSVDGKQEGSDQRKSSTLPYGKVFTNGDVIVLLKELFDFKTNHPDKKMADFHMVVKDKLHSNQLTRTQISEKIRRLKDKYIKKCREAKGKKPPELDAHESDVFDLSGKLWGENGVDKAPLSPPPIKRETRKRKVKKQKQTFHEVDEEEDEEVEEDLDSKYPVLREFFNDVPYFLQKNWKRLGRAHVERLDKEWREIRIQEVELFHKRAGLFLKYFKP